MHQLNKTCIHVNDCHHNRAIDILAAQLQRDKWNNGKYLDSEFKLGYEAYLKTSDREVWIALPNYATKKDSNTMAQILVHIYNSYGAEADFADAVKYRWHMPDDNPIWLMQYSMSEDEVKAYLARTNNVPVELMELEAKIPKATTDNPDDHRNIIHFAGMLSRRLDHPASALEIKNAWLDSKYMLLMGNPSDFDLDSVSQHIAGSFTRRKTIQENL